jgi:hypothetical protein
MRRPMMLLALVTTVAAPAHAQLRGVLNKAKQKIEQKATPQGEAGGEALSEATLGKVLAGAQAADRVLASRDAVQQRRDAADKRLSDLRTRNEPTRGAWTDASRKVDDCRTTALRASEAQMRERMQAKAASMMKDPAAAGRAQMVTVKYARDMAMAQQRGDTAAFGKLQRDMTREMIGEDVFKTLAADSAAASAKCGTPVAKPAGLVEEERLAASVTAADDSIRTLEAQALDAGAQAAAMDRVRYAQLKERTLSILSKLASGGGGYGAQEIALVREHRAELERVKRAL